MPYQAQARQRRPYRRLGGLGGGRQGSMMPHRAKTRQRRPCQGLVGLRRDSKSLRRGSLGSGEVA